MKPRQGANADHEEDVIDPFSSKRKENGIKCQEAEKRRRRFGIEQKGIIGKRRLEDKEQEANSHQNKRPEDVVEESDQQQDGQDSGRQEPELRSGKLQGQKGKAGGGLPRDPEDSVGNQD